MQQEEDTTAEEKAWRAEFATLEHPFIGEFQRDAVRETDQAVPARRLKGTRLNFHFAELRL